MQALSIVSGQTGQVTANPVASLAGSPPFPPGSTTDSNYLWTTDNPAVAVLLTANGPTINLRGGIPGTANVQATDTTSAGPIAGPAFALTVTPAVAVGFVYVFGTFS
jgi:hypothetical protein